MEQEFEFSFGKFFTVLILCALAALALNLGGVQDSARDIISNFGHSPVIEKVSVPQNGTNQTYQVEGADGKTYKTTSKPSENYYHLVGGIWMITKAPTSTPYPEISTPLFAKDYITAMGISLSGWDLRLNSNDFGRFATEEWIKQMDTAAGSYAGSSSNEATKRNDFFVHGMEDKNVVYLRQGTSDSGFSLKIPFSQADGTMKVLELGKTFYSVDTRDAKDLSEVFKPSAPTASSVDAGSTKTGASYKSAESITSTNQFGADKFGASASTESAPSGADKFG